MSIVVENDDEHVTREVELWSKQCKISRTRRVDNVLT